MVATAYQTPPLSIHPVQAVLLASMIPLFLGGLLSDAAYASTYEIQWSNFAAWLIAGAMVFVGISLLWSIIQLVRSQNRRGRPLFYFLALLALFILGLVNSFHHARDAWAVMPGGLILSVIVTALSLLATWLGFSIRRAGEAR